ncbi:MAG: hypothetical protein E7557_00840 [Ruminococcaceae bacterium]|nr:hypothetical protein [Oscillospiraceae bacterium]
MPEMQFKIKNTIVTISFTYLALILVLISLNKTEFLYSTLIFAMLHEAGHILALKYFKIKIIEFKLSLFGANIKTENYNSINNFQSAIISFCGPLVNLVFFLLFLIFNIYFEKHLFFEFSLVNFVLAFFNLLPFYSFDGGKILSSLLNNYFSDITSNKVITLVSIIILIPFSYFAFKVFIADYKNFYLLIASLLMLLTIIFKK